MITLSILKMVIFMVAAVSTGACAGLLIAAVMFSGKGN
jgi:hypothetical protein